MERMEGRHLRGIQVDVYGRPCWASRNQNLGFAFG